MMNVKLLSESFFVYTTFFAAIVLFMSYYCSNRVPPCSVWCPSAFPGWIIFLVPVGSFPCAKTNAIAEKVCLPPFALLFIIPFWDIYLCIAVRTLNNCAYTSIGPSFRKSLLSSTAFGTACRCINAILLDFVHFATMLTSPLNSIGFRGRIELCYIFSTATHRATATVLC